MKNKRKTFKEMVIKQEPKFEVGERVYFMLNDRVHSSKIERMCATLSETLSYRYVINIGWRDDINIDEKKLFKTKFEVLKDLSIEDAPKDTEGKQRYKNDEVLVRNPNEPWQKGILITRKTNLITGIDEFIVEDSEGSRKGYEMCIALYHKDYLGTYENPWDNIENK